MSESAMIQMTWNETCMNSGTQSISLGSPDIRSWVEAAQNGDQRAFQRLVEQFQRDVYGKAYSILRSHADADDVVQETFLRVWRALPGFRFESSFRTWLVTIATRQALNYRERIQGGESSLEMEEEGQEHPALKVESHQHEDLQTSEELEMLRTALPKLPKRQKEALLLRIQNDWKYEEIAQAMGTSVGSVKAHIFHAIRHLSEFVKGARP